MTYQQLVIELRAALEHLYDPHYLRRSPLTALFGISRRHDAPSALDRILTEAIAALEPGSDEPPDSRAWEVYEALSYRYVRGETREAVADHLGVSSRQLRRFLRAGLEQLAQQLWEQHRLGEVASEATVAQVSSDPGIGNSPLGRELAWLSDAAPGQATALQQALPAVLSVVDALARQHAVSLETGMAGDLPEVAVHPVALRQSLLTLLAAAIPDAAGGHVSLAAGMDRQAVAISIHSRAGRAANGQPVGAAADSLLVAEKIAEMCGGRLMLLCQFAHGVGMKHSGRGRAPAVRSASLSLPECFIPTGRCILSILTK